MNNPVSNAGGERVWDSEVNLRMPRAEPREHHWIVIYAQTAESIYLPFDLCFRPLSIKKQNNPHSITLILT